MVARVTIASVLTLVSLIAVRPVSACSCIPMPSRAELAESADAIFEARVGQELSEGGTSAQANGHATGDLGPVGRWELEVLRTWKGEAPAHLSVLLGSSCAVDPPPPGSQLIFYGADWHYCAVAVYTNAPEYSDFVGSLNATFGSQTLAPASPVPSVEQGGCGHCRVGAKTSFPTATMLAFTFLFLARRGSTPPIFGSRTCRV